MKNKTFYSVNALLIICAGLFFGCGKDFLEKKSNQKLLVPNTIADFWGLMDNSRVMNVVPFLNVIASDDVATTDTYLPGAAAIVRNSYLWANDVYEGAAVQDWSMPYQQVFYANIVLDGLKKVNVNSINQTDFNAVKGTAFFFRAFALYNLAQTFTVPYQKENAQVTPGLPVPLVSDVNVRPGRGTLKQLYDQILSDLRSAEQLLPLNVSFKTRPEKAAALGLLSKVYLIMGDYDNTLKYADSYLNLHHELTDYNGLNTSLARPFPNPVTGMNNEVIFSASVISSTFFTIATTTMVNNELFKSYTSNDVRKAAFFNDRGNNVVNMKGSYTGNGSPFAGITTNEIYLIKAECEARKELKDDALKTLNSLLIKRYKGYQPEAVSDAEEALDLILKERRKELVFRTVRWADLKRLNLETAHATFLSRVYKGVEYKLNPNDTHYVFEIPDNEIKYNPIEQNKRY